MDTVAVIPGKLVAPEGAITAYHEAAHCMAAMGAAYKLTFVTVDKIFRGKKQLGPGCFFSYPRFKGRGDAETCGAVMLAGVAVEIYTKAISPNSYDFAESLSSALLGGASDVSFFMEKIFPFLIPGPNVGVILERAIDFVSKNFQQISSLARVLIVRRYLTAREIRDLVGIPLFSIYSSVKETS